MAEQFDVIEAGGRGRRRLIGLLVVLALLGVPAVSLLASRDPGPRAAPGADPGPSPVRSLTRVESAPNLLNARATAKDGVETIRVVFPDGTRARVRYPAELDLDRLGSRPFQGLWVDGEYRQLIAPYNGELEITQGGEPIRSFAGHVTLWPRQAGSGSRGQVLLFAFGSWRMAMYDWPQGLDFERRLLVARELRGSVTGDGYLVLSGSRRVKLARPGDTALGAPAGPQLWFGGGATDMVALIPTPDCGEARGLPRAVRGRGHRVKETCRSGVRVVAVGDDRFVDRALDGIRITVE